MPKISTENTNSRYFSTDLRCHNICTITKAKAVKALDFEIFKQKNEQNSAKTNIFAEFFENRHFDIQKTAYPTPKRVGKSILHQKGQKPSKSK